MHGSTAMKRVLILYASSHGQTLSITNVLVRELRSRGFEVTARSALGRVQLPPPDGFDVIVFGSRVHFGYHASAIIGYLHQYARVLRTMPTVFFSVSMAVANGPADPSGYLDAMIARLGWRPNVTADLAGGLPYRKFNWILRFVMKQISKSAGHTTDTSRNHEFTNWNQVRALATDIAALARDEQLAHAN